MIDTKINSRLWVWDSQKSVAQIRNGVLGRKENWYRVVLLVMSSFLDLWLGCSSFMHVSTLAYTCRLNLNPKTLMNLSRVNLLYLCLFWSQNPESVASWTCLINRTLEGFQHLRPSQNFLSQNQWEWALSAFISLLSIIGLVWICFWKRFAWIVNLNPRLLIAL